jgi:hypothetical protein
MDEDKTQTQQPHSFFGEPHNVVIEQRASQVSVTAAEGMIGSERTRLHDALGTKDPLELPATAYAYDVVLKDLHSRLTTNGTGETRAVIEQALVALDALARPPTRTPAASDLGPGANGELRPGTAADINDEIAREKLDP